MQSGKACGDRASDPGVKYAAAKEDNADITKGMIKLPRRRSKVDLAYGYICILENSSRGI